MNNKTIILGTVSLDWHFAKGHYICNCLNTEDTNAFDRAICGLLYRGGGFMYKQAIATLLGFNVIDNPIENQYVDRSEKAIFDYAVASLVEYGLVVDECDTLRLTEIGKNSFETRTKQRTEDKETDLWVSEFTGAQFNKKVFDKLEFHNVEFTNRPDWNILYSSPLDVLNAQKTELTNASAGKSVKTMNNISMDYYVATLMCRICYNLETQQIFVCSYKDSSEIDEILSDNPQLQDCLLKKFFAEQQVSVIYRPSCQKDMEKLIIEQETGDIAFSNAITCQKDFLTKLNDNLVKDGASVIYFSVPKLSEDLRNYLRRINDVVVCVEYSDGLQNADQYYCENNVCYHHVDSLRTSDFCTYDNIYYSKLPYIVSYDGNDYNLPLLYKYEGEKYDYAKLFTPFISHILNKSIELGQNSLNSLNVSKKNPSASLVNNVLNKCKYINKMNFSKDYPELAKQLEDIAANILANWNKILHTKLYDLEADIIAGQDQQNIKLQLKQIESEAKSVISQDKDVQFLIFEVKQRLAGDVKIAGPNVHLQTVYILDTSIFMDMPKILDRFDLSHDRIIVPRAMEQELDGLTHDEEKKSTAKIALLQLRRKKDDHPQISIKDKVDRSLLPVGFDPQKKDNDMLATAIELQDNDTIAKIVIASNDKEFRCNVNDCVNNETLNYKIEAIDLDELLVRL